MISDQYLSAKLIGGSGDSNLGGDSLGDYSLKGDLGDDRLGVDGLRVYGLGGDNF